MYIRWSTNSNNTANETVGGGNSSQNQTSSADNNVTENATDNTNTTEVTTTVADTAGEAAISYASSKLRLHDDTEDCGFEGMIDAYIELFDESVVVSDTVHYCGTGNKRTVVPENAERFYYAYGKNVVVGNSDGTYALCQEDAIYPFVIEAGEQIGELKQFERYLDDVYYVVDANGKLYSGIQDRVPSIREYGNSEIGDEYGVCTLLKKVKAENVDELLQIAVCGNDFVVLLDDHTLYDVK